MPKKYDLPSVSRSLCHLVLRQDAGDHFDAEVFLHDFREPAEQGAEERFQSRAEAAVDLDRFGFGLGEAGSW